MNFTAKTLCRCGLAILLSFSVFSYASGDFLEIVISDPTVFMEVDGGSPQQVDLEVLFQIDTASYQPNGGPNGGGAYTDVTLAYTSVDLGLDGETGTGDWIIEFNGFLADSFALVKLDGPDTLSAGLSGFNGDLANWDGVSAFQTTGGNGSVFFQNGGPSDLVNGQLLESYIFNFNDTTVSARVIPEPASACVLCGLGLMAVNRRTRN